MLAKLKTLMALTMIAVLGSCGDGDKRAEGFTEAGIQLKAAQGGQPGAPISAPFSSEIFMAPDDGAQVSGIVRLEVRGAQMANVELLPANGYEPKYGIFRISEDKSIAWLDLDTTKLSNGSITVRASAFNVPAGESGGQEIIAMSPRIWNIQNTVVQGTEAFSASVTSAPEEGDTVSGIVRLEIRGNGIANAELLPASSYSPRLGVFNVSEDKTYAWLDFDTRSLPDGMREVRISAFNVTEGQRGAREIVAMAARSWNFSNGETDAFTATVTMAPVHGSSINGVARLEVRGSGLENVELLPAYGYEPKLGIFTITPDKSYAYLDVNTEDLPQGVFGARISAFNTPAGETNSQEIVAMPARQWKTPIADGMPAAGPLTNIQLAIPTDIAADANGNLYVVDGAEGHNRIRRISPDESVMTLVQLDRPLTRITDLDVTPGGNLYYIVSEASDPNYSSWTSEIWRIVNDAPAERVSSVGGSSLAVDPNNGDLYVDDASDVKRIRHDGSTTSLFELNAGGIGGMALHKGVLWVHLNYLEREGLISRWTRSSGLERLYGTTLGRGMVSADTGIYSIQTSLNRTDFDYFSCTVNIFNPDLLELTHVAGAVGQPCGYQDGSGQSARLVTNRSDIAQGSDGNLYVADSRHDVIRKVTPAGEVTTYAGVPRESGN